MLALGRISARHLGVQGTVGCGVKEPLAVSLGRQLTCPLRVRQPAMLLRALKSEERSCRGQGGFS